MNKTYCTIADDGSIRRLTTSEDGVLVPARDALATLIPPEWIPVHNIVTKTGLAINMAVRRGGHFIAAIPIQQLEVKARWRKAEEMSGDVRQTIYTPFISEGNAPPEVNPAMVSRTWTPPNNITMYMAILGMGPGAGVVPFFWWRRRADGQWLRPPLSNLYDDGKVCLGAGNHIRGASIQDWLMNAVEIFFSAPFGSHLPPRDDAMSRWVKYKLDANGTSISQVPPTAEMGRALQSIDTEFTQAMTAAISGTL